MTLSVGNWWFDFPSWCAPGLKILEANNGNNDNIFISDDDDDDDVTITMIQAGQGGAGMTRDYDNALTMSEVIHVTGQIQR